MTLSILPIWTTPDGSRTGPLNYPPARSNTDAERLVQRGFDEARRARGTDPRVIVVDDVTWATIKTFREGDEITVSITSEDALLGWKMLNAIKAAMEKAGAKNCDPALFVEALHGSALHVVSTEVVGEVAPALDAAIPASLVRDAAE